MGSVLLSGFTIHIYCSHLAVLAAMEEHDTANEGERKPDGLSMGRLIAYFRYKIKVLSEERYTDPAIVRRVHCSRSTVQRGKNRKLVRGELAERERSGRPSLLTPEKWVTIRSSLA